MPSRGLSPIALAFLLVLTGSAAHAADPVRPPEVRVEATDELGEVFADAEGRTLYTWEGDKPGESRCTDKRYTEVIGRTQITYRLPDAATRLTCQQMWPPLQASADSRPVGRWSIVDRADGAKQWAYNGKPLYRFFQDARPGEINGYADAQNRLTSGRYPVWAPTEAPGGVISRLTTAGRTLMTDKGRTLYALASETTGKIACAGPCLGQWKPLAAPAVAEEIGGWQVIDRPDGLRQWSHDGRPLYTFTGDVRFGEMSGADEQGWEVAVLQPPLAPPAGLTRQVTGDGEVFADAAGKTLYSWGCVEESEDRSLCDVPGASQTYRRAICGPPQTCIATWRPVAASADAKPVGRTWTVVTIDRTGAYQYQAPSQTDGLRVWAYRGRPVYTFAGDKDPGDMNGHNMRAFVGWGYSMLRVDGGGRSQSQ